MTTQQNERLARLEEKVDNVVEKLDDLIDNLDKRYAPRWVGDVVKGLVAMCLILVFAVVVQANFSKKTPDQVVTTTITNPDGSKTITSRTEPSSTPTTVSTEPATSPQSTPSGQTTQTSTQPAPTSWQSQLPIIGELFK